MRTFLGVDYLDKDYKSLTFHYKLICYQNGWFSTLQFSLDMQPCYLVRSKSFTMKICNRKIPNKPSLDSLQTICLICVTSLFTTYQIDLCHWHVSSKKVTSTFQNITACPSLVYRWLWYPILRSNHLLCIILDPLQVFLLEFCKTMITKLMKTWLSKYFRY